MRKYIVLILSIVLSVSLITATNTYAKKPKKEKPIPTVIEADELIYLQKENKAIYIGHVVVKRGDLTIYSNKLEVYLNDEGDVEKIIAIGNVRIYKAPDREGRADKAIYSKKDDTIMLIGNALLKQGKNVVEGAKIIYHITKEITEVKGAKKRRVKTIIFETKPIKKKKGKR